MAVRAGLKMRADMVSNPRRSIVSSADRVVKNDPSGKSARVAAARRAGLRLAGIRAPSGPAIVFLVNPCRFVPAAQPVAVLARAGFIKAVAAGEIVAIGLGSLIELRAVVVRPVFRFRQ